MGEYTVAKGHFPAKLHFPDGTMKEGHIYLAFQAAHHEGPERVIDILNQEEEFLPVHFTDGSVKLVNKEEIVMVSFSSEERATENLDSTDGSTHDVVVHLVNYVPLGGRFVSLLPAHARRLKDFLNQGEQFLELRNREEVYLINKSHILFVEEK